jgi:threonine dehydrogenase-like Zn-dependent dehydrogenase
MSSSKCAWPDCAVSRKQPFLQNAVGGKWTHAIGSDLHNYRQGEEGTGFILGHEIVGEIVEVGSAVTKFSVGDIVASPFASSCGESL